MPDSDGGACQGKALKLGTRGNSRSLGVTWDDIGNYE